MTKSRYINTKIWEDAWFSSLDPVEKLFFIYILTNPMTNIAGVYEISIGTICQSTGLDKRVVEEIFERFEKVGKVIYREGWLVIHNFIKHQNYKSPKIQAGIKAELENVPESLKQHILIPNELIGYFLNDYEPENYKSITRRQAVYVRDRGICAYCNKEILEDADVEIDHIIPQSMGGIYKYENLVLSCRACNQKKGNKTAKEYCGRDVVGKPFHIEKIKPILKNDDNLYNKVSYIYPTLIESTVSHSNSNYNSNYNYNNNNNIDTISSPSQIAKSFFANPDPIIAKLVDKGFSENQVRNEIAKFISYWTELNKSGTKQRWELQKTFEVQKRLNTWFNKAKEFNGDKIKNIVKI